MANDYNKRPGQWRIKCYDSLRFSNMATDGILIDSSTIRIFNCHKVKIGHFAFDMTNTQLRDNYQFDRMRQVLLRLLNRNALLYRKPDFH